eukprot:2992082-Alexandrium_andersonii.AAC.1
MLVPDRSSERGGFDDPDFGGERRVLAQDVAADRLMFERMGAQHGEARLAADHRTAPAGCLRE